MAEKVDIVAPSAAATRGETADEHGASASSISHDLRAGLVVSLIALPLCLGVANATGAPPLAGLIAGMVGGIVVALISRSPLTIAGPAAGLTVVIIDGMQRLG